MSIALDHHLFDTLYHAVALEEGATLVTADETYYGKAKDLGGVGLLADFAMWPIAPPQSHAVDRDAMVTLPDLPQTEIAIVEMTNAFRKDNKLAALKPNAALTAAARAFADYLGKSGKFGHEADGRHPAQRAEAQGYRHCTVTENLALHLDSRGFETKQLAHDAIEGWKASPGHRANMLRPHATEIGVGVVRAPDRHPKFISVQLFGRRSR